MKYRNEETLKDFFDYNDISLPLAFLINEKIVTDMNMAIESFINETFIVFLTAIGIEDEGFDSLDDILVEYFQEDDDTE
jgi:hypothetical protein